MKDKKQIGLYMEPSLHKNIVLKCKKSDRKISEVVRSLLRKWLEGEFEI